MAIGKSAYTSSNAGWTGGTSIPVLIDDSPYPTWTSWGAGQRDLFFLDANGEYITDFSVSSWNEDTIMQTITDALPPACEDWDDDGSCDSDDSDDDNDNVDDAIDCDDFNPSITYCAGDVDQSGATDLLDILKVVGFIVGTESLSSAQFSIADINQDSTVNLLDVLLTVSIIVD